MFPTQSLIHFAFVCHRFRNLINQIVLNRLLKAASLKDHKIILECYHPTAQYSEPYLLCEYLGTPGLNDVNERKVKLGGGKAGDNGIDELGKLYSRFLPHSKDMGSEPRILQSHPAGDVLGSRTSPTPGPSSASEAHEPEKITRTVSMEPHELFSQLCVSISLVQTGPRRGVFLSCVDVLKKTTTRIFRDWLIGRNGDPKEHVCGAYECASTDNTNKSGSSHAQCSRSIWVDQGKNVELRVRARERKWRRNVPILIHQDEDQAISYSLELTGMSFGTAFLDFIKRSKSCSYISGGSG